jgi:hypothetical protein
MRTTTFGPAVVAAVAVLLGAGCTTDDEPGSGGTATPAPTGSTATAVPTTDDAATDDATGTDATGTDTGGTDATTTDASTTTEETTGEETSDAPTGEATETEVPAALPPWTGDPVQENPQPAEEPQEITGVRTGLHDDYDRVVLDLSGDEPSLGWFARLVDETYEDGSGRPVEVEGDRFVELGINGIDWTREAPERYDGATVQGASTEVVTEVVFGVLFEGQQQIFVGLREDTDYRVFSLSDPARIVIDVRHP